eukprot:TRINITY_DN6423_c0_g1_i1.p1 TRINITY_DN6423_c0_g1~~TRINITY_DN6423_c0_g1_i1.p1  ORF type:complete len:442 (+),score=56.48 TRINITY_DN6423_c0_g1_i1:247-1572(+)
MYGFPVPIKFFKHYMQYLSQFVPNLSSQYEKFSGFFGPNNKLVPGVTKSDIPLKIVRSGIPPKYRGELWRLFCGVQKKIAENPGLFEEILEKHKTQTSEHTWQIEKDVPRTFPYFNDIEFDKKLRRVLVAYSWYNTVIGYCQSMNIIAGVLLVFMDEESAFWTLDNIVKEKLPHYYSSDMEGALVDTEILEDLLKQYAPKLYAHFTNCDIKLGIFSIPQYLTLFACKLPKETTFRIWDCMLYEGSKVVVEVMLEFICSNQDELLKRRDDADVVTFLNRQLMQIFIPEVALSRNVLVHGIDQKSLEDARIKYTKIVSQQAKNQSNQTMELLEAHMNTQFSWGEVKSIYKQFLYLSDSTTETGDLPKISLSTFKPLIRHVFPKWTNDEFVSWLFKAMDENKDNNLDFRELITGLNTLCKGQSYSRCVTVPIKDLSLSQISLNS